MDIKTRLKTYSFWVSLASAILLLIQTIARPLGLVINEDLYLSIVNSVLGVFVVLGIISHPSQKLLKEDESMIDEVIFEGKEVVDNQDKQDDIINQNDSEATSESECRLSKTELDEIRAKILKK